jgi:hypothetical protein
VDLCILIPWIKKLEILDKVKLQDPKDNSKQIITNYKWQNWDKQLSSGLQERQELIPIIFLWI